MLTNTPPSPLSLRQLSVAIGGELCLGDLPPVDGASTLGGRIVFTPAAIQPGVMFWDLSPPYSRHLHRPEEIFLRGATGIVSARRIEPWAGGFAIYVLNHPRAITIARQLARQQLFSSLTPVPTPLASR